MRYLLAGLLILIFSPLAADPIKWEFHPRWRQLLDRAVADQSWKGQFSGITDPHEINRRINRLSYRDDPNDRWLAPGAFFRAGGGDCEDFATAKYRALRTIGIADHRLMVLFGRIGDLEQHVVVLFDDQVLDLTDQVYPLDGHPTFLPVYALNETEIRVWLYDYDAATGRNSLRR